MDDRFFLIGNGLRKLSRAMKYRKDLCDSDPVVREDVYLKDYFILKLVKFNLRKTRRGRG